MAEEGPRGVRKLEEGEKGSLVRGEGEEGALLGWRVYDRNRTVLKAAEAGRMRLMRLVNLGTLNKAEQGT